MMTDDRKTLCRAEVKCTGSFRRDRTATGNGDGPRGNRPIKARTEFEDMMIERKCSHGRAFKTRCIECELIMAREAVAHAKDSLNQHSKLVAKLEAEQHMRATLAPS